MERDGSHAENETISRVRSTAIVIHQDKILSFHAIDPVTGKEYYFLPGGAIEADETAPESAVRETLEETGYSIKVVPDSCIDKEYLFSWKGKTYDCLTLFYKGVLVSPMAKKVQDADYNKGVHWIALAEIDKYFSYNSEILNAIKEIREQS